MQSHQASCLRGPVRRTTTGWPSASADPTPRRESTDLVSTNDPNVRWELVKQIRREIAAGRYETPEKLDCALDRLLEEFE